MLPQEADYIHTYMHTYIHTYIHTCMHTCIHAQGANLYLTNVDNKTAIDIAEECYHKKLTTYIHTCIHTYIHTYIHACMHACMHACIHAQGANLYLTNVDNKTAIDIAEECYNKKLYYHLEKYMGKRCVFDLLTYVYA